MVTVVERPQHMFMRVSVGIHGDDVEAAIEVRAGKMQWRFVA